MANHFAAYAFDGMGEAVFEVCMHSSEDDIGDWEQIGQGLKTRDTCL